MEMKTLGNVLWVLLAGLWSALGWLLFGALLAISVVGLPFARQCAKLARFSLWPFGRQVIDDPAASKLGPIGAVLWFIPGVVIALSYVIGGVLLCATVIGIPFGLQAFKLAGLGLAPFGKRIMRTSDVRRFASAGHTATSAA